MGIINKIKDIGKILFNMDIHEENIKPKPSLIELLESLSKIVLSKKDSEKFTSFIKKSVKEENYKNLDDFFNSQKVIDFIYQEAIWFYGYFDWKTESTEFDFFIRKALEDNFEIKLDNRLICDLDKNTWIHQVYQTYGNKLKEYDINLYLIDTISDSYTIMLVESQKVKEFEEILSYFEEFKIKDYQKKW